jgi:hypothetical protein
MIRIGQMEMQMTKLEQAVEALKSNKFATNSEFVEFLMSTLKMSKLGARTYAYNARKALGTTLEAAKKATKARYLPTVVDPSSVNPYDKKSVERYARYLHSIGTNEIVRDMNFDEVWVLKWDYARLALERVLPKDEAQKVHRKLFG